METLWQDLRYGFRALTKSPAFLVITVLSLALGIGANTAIFTVVKAVFLHPLPFRDPQRLVTLSTVDDQLPGLLPSSYPNLTDYRERQKVFSSMAITLPSMFSVNKTSAGGAENWSAEVVSGNFFETLGVKARLGRVFTENEDRTPGEAPLVVISHSAWTDKFGADPNLLGREIVINRRTFSIIGVMEPGFKGINILSEPAAWTPMSMAQFILPRPEAMRERKAFYFSAVARLRDGVSRQQADAALQPIAKQLAQDFPDVNRGRKVRLTPVTEAAINPRLRIIMENATLVLMIAVSLVLLIACANVAALLLVRARGRTKEFAVRLAVGAGSWRLARQMLTESLMLSLLGGLAGLLVARWGRDLLWKFRPPWVAAGSFDVSIDASVVAFALLVSVSTGVLFGLAPALTSWRRDLATELKERTSQGVREHRIFGMRSLLVIGQCALSLIALVGAGLFVESLRRLQQVNPGFDAAHLAVMRLNITSSGYSRQQVNDLYQRAVDSAGALPSVRAASISVIHPLGGGLGGLTRSVRLEGHETAAKAAQILMNAVAPRYFETMGARLISGREFAASDRTGAPNVVIVNETLAQRYWPNQSAIGKHVRFVQEESQREIVGVASDAKFFSLTEDKIGCVYLPLWQEYAPQVSLLVSTTGDPGRVLSGIRAELQKLDRNLPLSEAATMEDIIGRSLWAQKLIAGLLAVFGFLALLLAAVGVYGLTSYSVSQRTNEIGIRMALGATKNDVVRQIISSGMTQVIPGMMLGALAAMASSRVASNLLFGMTALYIPTYFQAALILLLVALLACYLPARRATRVDPVLALRHE